MTVVGITTASVSSRFSHNQLDGLVSEDLSSSTPHIFLDSASSSLRSRSTNASIHSASHMFLSYANPNRESSTRFILSKENRSSKTLDCRYPKPYNETNNGSTPHMFLSYTSDESPDRFLANRKRKQKKRRKIVSPCHEENEDSGACRKQSMFHEAVRFELRCLESFLSEDSQLSQHQASAAAKAVGRAAKTAATSHQSNYEDLFSLCGSVMDRVVNTTNHAHLDVAPTDDESMILSDLLDNPDLVVRRQQDEIEFLRLAVKELMMQLPKKVPRTPPTSTPSDQPVGVPQTIEFKRLEDDNVSNAVSAFSIPLQEDKEEMDERYTAWEMTREEKKDHKPGSDNDHVISKNIQWVAAPILRGSLSCNAFLPRTVPRPQICNSEATKTSTTESWRYMETLQVLFRSRPLQQSKFLLLDKGEAQLERARGINVQLNIRGVCFNGRYNGLVKNRIPHGQGVFRFENRDLYIGEFQDGYMHGEGTLFCRRSRSIAVLRGEFKDNEYIGQSTENFDTSQSAGAA